MHKKNVTQTPTHPHIPVCANKNDEKIVSHYVRVQRVYMYTCHNHVFVNNHSFEY